MRPGAFAMFDALGFKGVWERAARATPPWDVLGKLEGLVRDSNDVQGAAESAMATLEAAGTVVRTEIKTLFLSDTIVVGCWADSPKNPFAAMWTALMTVCGTAGNILARAAQAPGPTFAYRGCISYGEFDMRSTFIMGPAVDLAAESADWAQAGLVWLHPTAKRLVESHVQHAAGDLIRPWRVPLKDGQHVQTFVVSPYVGVQPVSWVDLRNAIMGTFEGAKKEDVIAKARNTSAFLDAELARLQAPPAIPA